MQCLFIGSLRIQDCLLRPGIHADAGGGQGAEVELKLRWNSPYVEGWLYH